MQIGKHAELPTTNTTRVVTLESITAYIQYEKNRGVSENALRRCRRFTASLYEWLPEDKIITKDVLLAWRQSLKKLGYSSNTELNYVKGVNCYLDYIGRSDLRFNRGRAKDISGKQFGYLTVIEQTGEKNRRDYIWRCRCRCGREIEFPATRLLTGNTLSCGCLRREHLKEANKYCDGTSLRQSMEEQIYSAHAESGYIGVTKKRDKWMAYISYKGSTYSLGCYDKLEDAVKARARGKEFVRMDAMNLLNFYEEIHKDDPARPNRENIRKMQDKSEWQSQKAQPQASAGFRAIRSDNTSGCPGVSQKCKKWIAKITYRKVTYQLGTFDNIDDAVAARREAEQQLSRDPAGFSEWTSRSGQANRRRDEND